MNAVDERGDYNKFASEEKIFANNFSPDDSFQKAIPPYKLEAKRNDIRPANKL